VSQPWWPARARTCLLAMAKIAKKASAKWKGVSSSFGLIKELPPISPLLSDQVSLVRRRTRFPSWMRAAVSVPALNAKKEVLSDGDESVALMDAENVGWSA